MKAMLFRYLKNKALIFAIIALCAFIIYNFTFVEHFEKLEKQLLQFNNNTNITSVKSLEKVEKQLLKMQTIKKEIDDLSKRLNMLIQSYSLLRCSISKGISDTDSWCSKHLNSSHKTDNGHMETLTNITSVKSLEKVEKQLLKMQTIKKERDDLSKRLNMLVQSYSLLKCSISKGISDTGGWCSEHLNSSHKTDYGLAKTLAKMFSKQTIASFGEGPGNYKRLLMKTGLIEVYDGFDGSPDINNMTNNEVKFLDLTIPHYGLPVYDWIFSFEVAEHIPENYENIYISNVIRHARKGVVISWAVPGQEGDGHVNSKTHEYVIEKLNSLCFIKDDKKSNLLRNSSKLWWLGNNLMVFYRHSTCPLDEDEA